jgi:signal peptidase I
VTFDPDSDFGAPPTDRVPTETRPIDFVPTDGGPLDGEPIGPDDGPAATKRRHRKKSSTRNAIEWAVVIFGAILIAVVLRTFVLQTFWIPSESMSTTLVKNDRVVVNKLSYRLHDVHRGDVVVFERPPGETDSKIKDLIKRVVGLEGEHVRLVDGKVLIDGKALEEPYTHGQATTPCPGDPFPELSTAEGLLVPKDHVLVMGDNRSNSQDGRCFGPIDEDLIVGRAFIIIWPPSKIGGL